MQSESALRVDIIANHIHLKDSHDRGPEKGLLTGIRDFRPNHALLR